METIYIYRIVQNHLQEFIKQFKWSLTSRQIFEWEKMKRPETLTDIHRAVRFFYLQKHAFGNRVEGQCYGIGKRINLSTIKEDLSQAHLRLSRVNIENLPWQDIFKRYDKNTHYFSVTRLIGKLTDIQLIFRWIII